MWTKSKVSLPYSHSSVQSSTSNWTLGGTQLGWMGERSVPVTVADGNRSANSLCKVSAGLGFVG